MDTSQVKSQFTLLKNSPKLAYLDNAATTQKPKSVIKAIGNFYRKDNANVHRGIYDLSERATRKYEQARAAVAALLHAKTEEVIFTSGTTDSINLLARSLQNSGIIAKNPKILVTELEHHSNYLPWRSITDNLTHAPINKEFRIDWPEGEFDIVAVTHISNVTGTEVDLKQVRKKYPKALLVVDAAQSIAHREINVRELDVDFLAFSGHKMYGPTGIGVLYGKKDLLEKLPPMKLGGGMIKEVSKEKLSWAGLPEKHEAGTPPIAQAVGLATAVKLIQKIGLKNIAAHEEVLRQYAQKKLESINGTKLYHPAANNNAGAVMSFSLEDIHPHDIAQLLGNKHITVRAGHHCCQILHREVFQIPASTRISLAVYNTKEDIDKLIEAIREIRLTFDV